MAEAVTWVVTIRVEPGRDRRLVRMFVAAPTDDEAREFVVGSVEEACAALASYLRERIG